MSKHLQIELVPETSRIPNLCWLEEYIEEGDTNAYLSDSDGLLHTYTKNNDELIYCQYTEGISVEELLAKIEESVEML